MLNDQEKLVLTANDYVIDLYKSLGYCLVMIQNGDENETGMCHDRNIVMLRKLFYFYPYFSKRLDHWSSTHKKILYRI